jgi:diadenylate cyclase
LSEVMNQFSNMLWNIVNRPRIPDVLDILIVAFMLYQILKYARETRMSQLAKGVAFLLVAAWLSDLIGLRTVSAILRWVIGAGPVVIIVLFQPEIRRLLEELGNTSFFERGHTQMELEMAWLVSEMTQALLNMSKRKVGALIVIEQRTRLKEVIETGTRVDGVISQPLIENIFEPNTPLHDGAVIIRGDRVVAAACLLPLSEGSSIGRELGTRHRAGLGVSEVTDGVVFIVSEESGVISMARGGKLTRHLDARSIGQILHTLYDPQPQETRHVPLNLKRLKVKTFKESRRQAHDERSDEKK